MESNWRWNIWQYGVTGLFIRLVATLRTPSIYGEAIFVGGPFAPQGTYRFLRRVSTPVDQGYLPDGPAFVNPGKFPFGFDVFPD